MPVFTQLPMAIQLHVEQRSLNISASTQALAKAASSRHALLHQCHRQLAIQPLTYHSLGTISLHEAVLQCVLNQFSEQLIFQPIEEIMYYFSYSSGAFLEPGYPPLFYSRQNHKLVTPNKSAVAGIGEAVAGFLSQRLYRCRILSRPNHDYPDVVMDDSRRTVLVEAKATTTSLQDLKKALDEELVRMIAYVSACLELEVRPVAGLLIGTFIENTTTYCCCVTEVIV